MKRILSLLVPVSVFVLGACGSNNEELSNFLDSTARSNERFVCKTGGDGVNLRSAPDTDSDVVSTLEDNRKVIYNGEVSGEFVKVEVANEEASGWLKAAFLCTAPSSSGGGGTYGANANVKAFLDVIGYSEGTDDSYNIMFTGARFSGYGDHPRSLRCNYGLCSDAAGRYQFLSTTWDSVKRGAGVYDFSPESQDKGCIYLLESIGVYNRIVGISSIGDFESAVYGAATTWASFPGSPYGQPTHSLGTLWAKFQEFRRRY
jgi:muramidase (phage lysozyme)